MIFSAFIPIEALNSNNLIRKRLLETEIALGEAHRKFNIDSTKNLLFWINYYMGYEGIPQILVFENSKELETDINERIKRGAYINSLQNEIYIRNGEISERCRLSDFSDKMKESLFVNFNNVNEINYYRIMNDTTSKAKKIVQPCIFELLFKRARNINYTNRKF